MLVGEGTYPRLENLQMAPWRDKNSSKVEDCKWRNSDSADAVSLDDCPVGWGLATTILVPKSQMSGNSPDPRYILLATT